MISPATIWFSSSDYLRQSHEAVELIITESHWDHLIIYSDSLTHVPFPETWENQTFIIKQAHAQYTHKWTKVR